MPKLIDNRDSADNVCIVQSNKSSFWSWQFTSGFYAADKIPMA